MTHAVCSSPRSWFHPSYDRAAIAAEQKTGRKSPSGADLARAWFESSPFIEHLGLELESIGNDAAIVTMPFRAELATAGDIVHGGAISTLIDTSAACAAWSSHNPDAGLSWGTVGLSLSFLASGRGEALRARARVSRRGKSICHCRVEVEDAGGKPIAEGLVAYRLG